MSWLDRLDHLERRLNQPRLCDEDPDGVHGRSARAHVENEFSVGVLATDLGQALAQKLEEPLVVGGRGPSPVPRMNGDRGISLLDLSSRSLNTRLAGRVCCSEPPEEHDVADVALVGGRLVETGG